MRLPDINRVFISAIIRRLAYVLVGLLIAFVTSFDASAEILPATKYYVSGLQFSKTRITPQQSCEDHINTAHYVNYTYNSISQSTTYPSQPSWSCRGTSISTGNLGHVATTYEVYHCDNYENATLIQDGYPNTCDVPEPENPCEPDQSEPPAYYNYGTDPNGDFPYYVCENGCSASFNGSAPATRELVGGQYNYFAFGFYSTDGFECSSGDSPLASTSSTPAPSCGSGQVMGTVNGKTVCVNSGTGQIDNPNAPKTETTKTETTNPPVSNPDGSTTTTTTITNNNGTTTTITNTTYPDGSNTVTTETTSQTDPEENKPDSFCAENPESPLCKETESGNPESTSGLYTPDGRKSFETVIGTFKNDMLNAPAFQSLDDFFTVSIPSGSCTGLNTNVSFGDNNFPVDLESVMCSSTANYMYSLLGIGVLLASTWLGFRIAIL